MPEYNRAIRPACALLISIRLLAPAGVPSSGAFKANFLILAAIVVVATAIALFFFARVVYSIYMQGPWLPWIPPGIK
jgi:NADH:ubiquinone oxidoreductase subunit 2 (subunit N)